MSDITWDKILETLRTYNGLITSVIGLICSISLIVSLINCIMTILRKPSKYNPLASKMNKIGPVTNPLEDLTSMTSPGGGKPRVYIMTDAPLGHQGAFLLVPWDATSNTNNLLHTMPPSFTKQPSAPQPQPQVAPTQTYNQQPMQNYLGAPPLWQTPPVNNWQPTPHNQPAQTSLPNYVRQLSPTPPTLPTYIPTNTNDNGTPSNSTTRPMPVQPYHQPEPAENTPQQPELPKMKPHQTPDEYSWDPMTLTKVYE